MASRLDDPSRLHAVRRSGIVDSERELVFDELTKAAAQVLRAPYALISIMDNVQAFWKSTYGLPDSMRSEDVADSFCQYVVERGQDLFTEDVRHNEITRSNPTIEAKGLRAWAGCPVEFEGEILGTLCVIDSQIREWTAEDRHVLHALAAIASREIALRVQVRDAQRAAERATSESARIRSLLDTLRASLLPPLLPTIVGLDLGAWFEAADDGNMLLGDFYDMFPLGNGRWGLVVGDVCGHGVEAAKLTSLVRYSLRSAAVHHRDPARVLEEVDAAIRSDTTDVGRFATVCYFHIDTREGIQIRWARAGHPYPVISSATTNARICRGADGPPVGITIAGGPSTWSVGEFTLEPGERVLIYTDGLTDGCCTSTGERLGEARLLEIIDRFDGVGSEPSDPSSATFVAHLTGAVRLEFSVRADDIALVVLHATPVI